MRMDLYRMIQELRQRQEHLNRVIAALEQLQHTNAGPAFGKRQRGRKFMDAQERREVSERMKRYWAARRVAKRHLAKSESGST